MKFSADWHDEAVNAAPEERATVADLRIELDGQIVSMHLKGKTAVECVTLPLYSLAEGLIHDWWALFGGRDREFSLVRHRSGFALPDVRMRFDGSVFEILAQQRSYRNPDVRFWGGATEIMGRTEAEAALANIIEMALERLTKREQIGTSASLRWERVNASREDSDEAAFCEAAGALGLDPYQIDAAATDTIERASSVFAEEPLVEFLAGAQATDQVRLMDWIGEVDRRPHFTSRVAELRALADATARTAVCREGEQAWELGYRRAKAFRATANIDEARRFDGFRSLAEYLGASRSFRLAPQVNGIRLLRADQDDGSHLHMRVLGETAAHTTSHLFTFARGVADVVCFPDPQNSPVNELHSAYRQAAGRAFAAELLAPVNEILSMMEDGRDVVTIADALNVSTVVVERQIQNAPRIAASAA
ncbi:hypothetical protein [Caulobacter sp. Root655]|uniref:hypothetical protein n=1 Tax=Caulobacter sp. Root655 TaxID=1736578 RepID=UPI000AAE49A9|nr:hypothetical protein [Caulobacter sp. Root655]